jgi:hypothetical protein
MHSIIVVDIVSESSMATEEDREFTAPSRGQEKGLTGIVWPQGAHYFFDPPHISMQGHVVNFNAAETKSLTDRCASWHVPYGTVEDELRRQNVRNGAWAIYANVD